MVAVRDQLHDLDNTDAVIMTFADPASLRRHATDRQYNLPVVTSPDQSAYRAFGLGRGSFRQIWGTKTVKRYAEIFRTDGFGNLRRPVDDTRQLGGDFVIAPDGRLIYAFSSTGPADRPSVDDLIAAINRDQTA